MQAGCGLICRECVHHLAKLWRQGHVAPCKVNRWEETKHVSPKLSDDGRECESFEARAEEPVEEEAATA